MNGVMNIFRDSTSTLAATDPNLAELRVLKSDGGAAGSFKIPLTRLRGQILENFLSFAILQW